jgi:tetratricopeptide (TPR) repeat protein
VRYASQFRSAAAILTLGFLLIAGCAAPNRSAPAPVPEPLAFILRQGEEAETRGDKAAAGAAYERAALEFEDYSAAWSHLGEFRRFWARDLDAAWDAFKKAILAPKTQDASVAFAWRGLGEIARGRGGIDQAIECFKKSLSVKPIADAHRSLSALYATEKRDFDKAAHHAKAAVDLSPDDPIALIQYAVQMVRFKKPQEAEEAFAKAIRVAGCDERGRSNDAVHCCVLYNGACYHAVKGDKDAALAMLKEFFMATNHRHITREEILRDPDFESLVKDPDFKALLDYRLPEE